MEIFKRIQLKEQEKLFVPFYNVWNQNKYIFNEPFEFQPFTINALSTSGSPIVIGENFLVGYVKECLGIIKSDGKVLTISSNSIDEIFYCEGSPQYCIDEYNKVVLPQFTQEFKKEYEFWKEVEYCTWVEQLNAEHQTERNRHEVLTDEFVKHYIDRIENLGLKKGKFTIDAGWNVNAKRGYGDFIVDDRKFPHMDETIKYIANAGYQPGIWLSPALIANTSDMYSRVKEHCPQLYMGGEDNSGIGDLYFQEVNEIFKEHYGKILADFIGMGVKKFKIDIYYGNKMVMKENLKYIYETVKSLDDSVEVESHIPDPFISQYCDVVRLNDVVIRDGVDWRDLTQAHYNVCNISSPHKIFNLDHIGGNNINISEELFVEHLKQLNTMKGYKVVSFIPDKFSQEAIELTKRSL